MKAEKMRYLFNKKVSELQKKQKIVLKIPKPPEAEDGFESPIKN